MLQYRKKTVTGVTCSAILTTDRACSAFGAPKNNEMTLKIARTNDTPRSASDSKAASSPGWDPFEVWRTRVLLPRLAENTTAVAAAKGAATNIQLIRGKR